MFPIEEPILGLLIDEEKARGIFSHFALSQTFLLNLDKAWLVIYQLTFKNVTFNSHSLQPHTSIIC